MFFDSHTHVNFEDFDNDRDAVIKRCLDDDIWMINVGSDVAHSEKAVAIAQAYEKGVYASVGIHPVRDAVSNGVHPHDAMKTTDDDFAVIERLSHDAKVVGIGETGLDYFRIKNEESGIKDKQKELFIKHIELAKKVGKPLIIHCRDAHADMVSILQATSGSTVLSGSPSKDYKLPAHPGVMHFFCGTAEEARAYCDLGFFISFSGVITFARDYDDAVRAVPLERILVETDAPFVTPVPYRGKRNEPRYVEYAARKVAEIKGISFEEVAEQTTRNARKLFSV